MNRSGLTVHLQTFTYFPLRSSMKSRGDVSTCSMESRTPRQSRRRANVQKEPSTALIREHDVGVKWKIQRRMPKAANRVVGTCRLRLHVFVCKVILQIPSGAITVRKWVLGVQINPVLEGRKLRAGNGSCTWETK